MAVQAALARFHEAADAQVAHLNDISTNIQSAGVQYTATDEEQAGSLASKMAECLGGPVGAASAPMMGAPAQMASQAGQVPSQTSQGLRCQPPAGGLLGLWDDPRGWGGGS